MPPLGPRLFGYRCRRSGAGSALVLESVALAGDLHDVGVVQEPIQHRGRQCLVVGKGPGPLRERQVAGQNHAATLVALGNDVEEQVRLVAPEGQVADLIDHQQARPHHHAVEVLPEPLLAVCRRELQHQVGRADEARLDPRHDGAVGQRNRQVALAHAAGAEQDDVLRALDEAECRQFLKLRTRRSRSEGEVVLLQGLHRREGGHLQQRLARAFGTGIGFGAQQRLEKVGKARLAVGRPLREVRPIAADAFELEALAQLADAVVLQVHGLASNSWSYTDKGCCRLSCGSARPDRNAGTGTMLVAGAGSGNRTPRSSASRIAGGTPVVPCTR